MRRTFLILVGLMIFVTPAMTAPTYFFGADEATGILVCSDDKEIPAGEDMPSKSFEYKLPFKTKLRKAYRCFVTQAQYGDGSDAAWAAIPQALKDTAKSEAQEERKDFEVQFQKLLKAFALVVLDEINVLRQQHGLPVRTTAQLKAAVKARYDTLP
jgi:hypothetical protein